MPATCTRLSREVWPLTIAIDTAGNIQHVGEKSDESIVGGAIDRRGCKADQDSVTRRR